ncbi:hypothetical protein J7E93_04915 [Streptomyces sp. ISL-36]|uniref:hypothetical protein n=1 Tax=Streptomyces sp. ISL-36 TaxID=2819182 RepID=UPI001BE54913|nr:hypothetical protein [Streptomyces sp. ISL-36]MBT2439474.1 hypothetical protein [Streptomyces sp. ISL-36]
MFRLSPRSWLILAVPVIVLLVLTALLTFPSSPLSGAGAGAGPGARGRPPALAGPLRDAPLPGGGTARLSKCQVDEWPRPVALGDGERDTDPRLTLGGWGAFDAGTKTPGPPRFTVHAAVHATDRPLLLDAPVSRGRVTLDIHGPHGEGLRASARGLTATVMDGARPDKPVQVPPSGRFRVAPGKPLLLDVELPAGAVCPGYTLLDVARCSPADTNDAADCPVVTLTVSDPAVRAHRAAVTGRSPAGISERLVMVSLEPYISQA